MTVTASGRRMVILGDVRKFNIGLTESQADRSHLERPAGDGLSWDYLAILVIGRAGVKRCEGANVKRGRGLGKWIVGGHSVVKARLGWRGPPV